MNTPITDKLASPASHFIKSSQVLHASHARKLERDRAALMQTLDLIRRVSTDSWAAKEAKEALDLAKTTFPEQP